jgi:mannose-6-phosphate isomerase-like protein (cupin superfamily)
MAERVDPRTRLQTYAKTESEGNASAEVARFYDTEPDHDDGTVKSWFVRGQNFVLALSEAQPGAVLERHGQVDEYLVLLEHETTAAEVSWDGQSESVSGNSIVMIPPGDSRIELPNGGRVTQLYTSKSEDLVAKCPNASSYATPKPNVAPYEAWPEPTGGWKIRAYSLDVEIPEGGFAKMFRNTNFMVNVFRPFRKPRDPKRMSPHSHDDFEQCSLVLSGDYVHSLRWEWGKDLDQWREDEHIEVGAPSAVVIPASTIHSSRWISEGESRLVDIFSPPRVDFSKVDGWVLNADDYPMPAGI